MDTQNGPKARTREHGLFKATRSLKPGVLALVLLASMAFAGGAGNVGAHPVVVSDPHHACFDFGTMDFASPGTLTPSYVVGGTESYHAQMNLPSLGCSLQGLAEWGSHAGVCPPPIFNNVMIQGALCSDVVANPSQSVTCEWEIDTIDSLYATLGLVVGFDRFPYTGLIDVLDGPVFGGPGGVLPGDQASITMANPHPVPARVIAFPTNMESDDLDPGAIHKVECS